MDKESHHLEDGLLQDESWKAVTWSMHTLK